MSKIGSFTSQELKRIIFDTTICDGRRKDKKNAVYLLEIFKQKAFQQTLFMLAKHF